MSLEMPSEGVRRGRRACRGREKMSGGDFGGYRANWYDTRMDVYFDATESRKDGVTLGY